MSQTRRQYGHLSVHELINKVDLEHPGNPLARLLARQLFELEEEALTRQDEACSEISENFEGEYAKQMVPLILDKITSLSPDELMEYFEVDFKECLQILVDEVIQKRVGVSLYDDRRINVL